jgi:hypothetical protein
LRLAVPAGPHPLAARLATRWPRAHGRASLTRRCCPLRCAVAYVKFDKASSAALAIESLHQAVLNNGKGPKLKVMPAEAPPSK